MKYNSSPFASIELMLNEIILTVQVTVSMQKPGKDSRNLYPEIDLDFHVI